jgi:hypothetical protein
MVEEKASDDDNQGPLFPKSGGKPRASKVLSAYSYPEGKRPYTFPFF